MKKFKDNEVVIALLVFISRFAGLPANISPLGSFAFFGGNFYLYMLMIVVFDFIKGGFYRGFIFTYLGFASYWLVGRVMRKSRLKMLFLPLASLSFFLLSNFGVWLSWYPHSLVGLKNCYILALPFYRNTLIGDVVFGLVFSLFVLLPKSLVNHDTSISVKV